MSMKEQLQLIADSKIIFATHGSGLANCAVLSKSSLIIEVCPKSFYTKTSKTKNQFHIISEIVECKYIYLMSNEDRSININNIKDIFDKYEI